MKNIGKIFRKKKGWSLGELVFILSTKDFKNYLVLSLETLEVAEFYQAYLHEYYELKNDKL